MTVKTKPFILDRGGGSKVELGWLDITLLGRQELLEAPDPFYSLTMHPRLSSSLSPEEASHKKERASK